MGNRLSKIVTRTGDSGTTGLGDGSRTSKDSFRIQAIGDIDELNCVIGMVLTHELPAELTGPLQQIQQELFEVGGELSMPGHALLDTKRIIQLDKWVEEFNNQLPPLKDFVMPGGTPASAHCHLARAVCRRAERQLVGLAARETVRHELRQYINRLSDLLFIMARLIMQRAEKTEQIWDSLDPFD